MTTLETLDATTPTVLDRDVPPLAGSIVEARAAEA
jgi:hypothetical protein